MGAPALAPPRARTLVADFDSLRQAAWVTADDSDLSATWFRFRAALRLSHLVSTSILVTDAQLLDGICFLAAGPSGIANMLGVSDDAPLPIVVLSRRADLGDALEAMSANPGFEWSSANALAVAGDGLKLQHGDLVASRNAWVDAARTGRIVVEPFGADFPLAELLRQSPAPAELPADLTAQLRATVNRSHARALIREAAITSAMRDSAERWWNNAYAATLARQHQASWLTFTEHADGDGDASPIGRWQLVRRLADFAWRAQRSWRRRRAATDADRREVELDGSILSTMGHVPPGLYGEIAYRAREVRDRWVAKGDKYSLLSLALCVRTVTAPAESWRRRRFWTWARTLIMFATAIVTVVLAFGTTAGTWAVALPIVVALLSEVPYGDIKGLVEERPGRLSGILHVPVREAP